MYDDFRMAMLRELAVEGLDDDALRRVMAVVDRMGVEYDVSRRCTALVPIEMTSQHILLEYLACKSLEGFSRETLKNYHTALLLFLMTVKKPIEELRTNDIRAYLYKYQNERGVSNRTLDHLRSTIAGFFHWLFEEGRIDRDPTLAIHPIKFVVKPKPSLSPLQMELVRKKLGGPRERAIIEMFYSTGCRVSELAGMKLSDIDMENATVQIFGKGGKYRTSFLNAKAIVALRDYLDLRTDDSEYLFVSERKPYGKLTRAAVEKIVRIISDRAFKLTGVHITPHIFRHTTISTALRNGMPIQNVSKMVGHSEIKTTMYYAQIDTADVQHDHLRYVS